jgi:hypothetical protein
LDPLVHEETVDVQSDHSSKATATLPSSPTSVRHPLDIRTLATTTALTDTYTNIYYQQSMPTLQFMTNFANDQAIETIYVPLLEHTTTASVCARVYALVLA